MDGGTNLCGGVECAPDQQCLADACYGNVCDGTICPPGMVCAEGMCVEALCVGVVCPPGTRCAGGVCVSDSCGGTQCPAGEVCVAGACVDAACANKACGAGEVCANGQCVKTSCGAQTCAPGTVCQDDMCVDAACAFVTCTMGGVCVDGTCRFPGCGSAQCNDGFVCTSQGSCRSAACAGVACPADQVCNAGQCFPTNCPSMDCGPGEVCDLDTCVPLDCAGIRCATGEACAAGGRCLPTACAGVDCPGIWVCDMGTCADPRCVGVTCPAGDVCSGGTCWPLGPPGGPPCGAGKAFIGGACRELVCEGVTCPTGQACQGGACFPGVGVFPAGYTRVTGNGAQEGVVASREQGVWKKLNQTPLPPLKQLALSPDGQTFYAVGTDGTFYYSTDGVVWNQRWSGTTSVTGAFRDLEVDKSDGRLYGSIEGGSGLGKAVYSTDRGDSWSFLLSPPGGGFGSTSSVYNVSVSARPGRFYYSYWDSYVWAQRGIHVWTNGAQQTLADYGNLEPRREVRAHPTNPDQAFALNANTSLIRLEADGGYTTTVKGAFNTCVHCMEWKVGDPSLVLASSGVQVFKSSNGGDSWGARTTGLPAGAALRHMAQDRGGAFYVGNETAGQATLLGTVDDGESWQTLNADMDVVTGLFDRYTEWAPDASVATNAVMMPTTPNGYIYRATKAGLTGDTEPGWPSDAGVTVNDGTTAWVQQGKPSLMRVTSIAARTCPLGEALCGVTCVRVFDNRDNCGGCGNVCGPGVGCFLGTCLGSAPDAGADGGVVDAGALTGIEAGCADGTREGFTDVLRLPNVAACAGAWAGELTDAANDALCGAGWHICDHADTELRQVSYVQATAFPGCFAYRASNDFADGCEPLDCRPPPTAMNQDDIAGVGRGCALLSGVSVAPASVPASSPGACLMDKGVIDAQCCSVSDPAKMAPRPAGCLQRGETGVVCCRD